jgi:hypothetical protein
VGRIIEAVIDVPPEDVAACRTGRDWARRFVALNPEALAFDVVVRYGELSLTERLGHLDFKMIRTIQAEVGASGLTPAKLEAMDEERRVRGAERRARLDRYRRMSTAELIALPDKECARAVAVRFAQLGLWGLLRATASFLARGWRGEPAPVKRARAAWLLDADVCNGGFDQLFRNSSAGQIEEGREGLVALGAGEAAEVVARALAHEREKRPQGRQGDLESPRDVELEPLNEAYYAALPRTDPGASFSARLAAYVRQYPKGF